MYPKEIHTSWAEKLKLDHISMELILIFTGQWMVWGKPQNSEAMRRQSLIRITESPLRIR